MGKLVQQLEKLAERQNSIGGRKAVEEAIKMVQRSEKEREDLLRFTAFWNLNYGRSQKISITHVDQYIGKK